MPIVDNAVYVDGRRTPDPSSLEEIVDLVEQRHGSGWIGLDRPSEAELRAVADEFALHPLAALKRWQPAQVLVVRRRVPRRR
ncbi:MAG TPA: hypothetical protein VIG76_11945 [Amnibacterium sp.]|jgi:magnesium transporter|uniref:hypothetical protein n=1 Tax=Amnibacterium sp. TaxID=1872496 RepID=UPI002F92CFB2